MGSFFKYDGGDKKVEMEMFIHNVYETIMRETDSNIFIDNIIKPIVNKYNNSRRKWV